MPNRRIVLVADDDPSERMLVTRALTRAGYRVVEARDGEEALELVRTEAPDLILLDVRMTGLSGFDVVEQMRARGDTVLVMMLTGLDEIDFKVHGFASGADDYLSKRSDPRELLARVKALLRRVPLAKKSMRLHFGETMVDLTAKLANRSGVKLLLTRTEFAILAALAAAKGAPVNREDLLQAVWGYSADTKTRTLETHIWRLRKKIGDTGEQAEWILNVSGLGYALRAESYSEPGRLIHAFDDRAKGIRPIARVVSAKP